MGLPSVLSEVVPQNRFWVGAAKNAKGIFHHKTAEPNQMSNNLTRLKVKPDKKVFPLVLDCNPILPDTRRIITKKNLLSKTVSGATRNLFHQSFFPCISQNKNNKGNLSPLTQFCHIRVGIRRSCREVRLGSASPNPTRLRNNSLVFLLRKYSIFTIPSWTQPLALVTCMGGNENGNQCPRFQKSFKRS